MKQSENQFLEDSLSKNSDDNYGNLNSLINSENEKSQEEGIEVDDLSNEQQEFIKELAKDSQKDLKDIDLVIAADTHCRIVEYIDKIKKLYTTLVRNIIYNYI